MAVCLQRDLETEWEVVRVCIELAETEEHKVRQIARIVGETPEQIVKRALELMIEQIETALSCDVNQ